MERAYVRGVEIISDGGSRCVLPQIECFERRPSRPWYSYTSTYTYVRWCSLSHVCIDDVFPLYIQDISPLFLSKITAESVLREKHAKWQHPKRTHAVKQTSGGGGASEHIDILKKHAGWYRCVGSQETESRDGRKTAAAAASTLD